jgi:large subunit ribosomal protein L2
VSLHKAKPTSAGRRFVVAVKTSELHKGKPHAPLLDKKTSKGGRNNNGRITVRHQGGGHKQRYRIIDFKRNKDGIAGEVERLEYDPNRSAHMVCVPVRRSSVVKMHRSSRVTLCQFVRFPLVPRFITLR